MLPTVSKLLEKLFLNKIKPLLEELSMPQTVSFVFTIEQIHRVADTINKTFGEGNYCSADFLDINVACDKVWHQGLLFRLKHKLPPTYYLVLQSYLTNRYFQVKQQEEVSTIPNSIWSSAVSNIYC